jgi:hypothetical protein
MSTCAATRRPHDDLGVRVRWYRHPGVQQRQVRARPQQGKVVQVAPITRTLKASVSERLKPKHVKLLSSFAFKFNLRSYNKDSNFETFPNSFLVLFQCLTGEGQGLTLLPVSAQLELFCPPYNPT